jgi:endonuclease/exonuclease/phosphatase family metal-dependent hydrolase
MVAYSRAALLVRTWNLFHGNTVPPGRKAYLREMVELVTRDRPDVVLLQEIPWWALPRLGTWAGMQCVWARAKRPRLGPLPIPASLGRVLTAPNHGLARSGFAGQGNAILFPSEAMLREHKTITLNTNVFAEERGQTFGLTSRQTVAWEKERRVCQVVRYELPNRLRFLVANLHASHIPDTRLADAEARRAVNFVIRSSELEESLIVGGDFNVPAANSSTVLDLINAPRESRWNQAGGLIDWFLLRRARARSARVWTNEERTVNGKLLSDHAPVELDLELRPKD